MSEPPTASTCTRPGCPDLIPPSTAVRPKSQTESESESVMSPSQSGYGGGLCCQGGVELNGTFGHNIFYPCRLLSGPLFMQSHMPLSFVTAIFPHTAGSILATPVMVS